MKLMHSTRQSIRYLIFLKYISHTLLQYIASFFSLRVIIDTNSRNVFMKKFTIYRHRIDHRLFSVARVQT